MPETEVATVLMDNKDGETKTLKDLSPDKKEVLSFYLFFFCCCIPLFSKFIPDKLPTLACDSQTIIIITFNNSDHQSKKGRCNGARRRNRKRSGRGKEGERGQR